MGDGSEVLVGGVGVAVEAEAVFAKQFRRDFCRLNVVFAEEVGANLVKAVKIEAVVLDRFFGAAFFYLDVFEKIVNQLVDIHKGIIP